MLPGGTVSDLEKLFTQAQQDVNRLASRPDNDTMLKLYALYKQATKGDATGDPPGGFDFVARSQVRRLVRDERHLAGGCHAAVPIDCVKKLKG